MTETYLDIMQLQRLRNIANLSVKKMGRKQTDSKIEIEYVYSQSNKGWWLIGTWYCVRLSNC